MCAEPTKAPGGDGPVRVTSISVNAFGVRVRADGRTGWEAWQLLRRRNPWLAWGAAGYLLLIGVTAGLIGWSLV